MTERVGFLASNELDGVLYEPAIYRGLVTCLESSDKCQLLRTDMEQPGYERRVILSLIAKDLQASFEDCHEQLVDKLVNALPVLSPNKRQSCGYCLETLAADAPGRVALRIVDTLLGMPYRSILDRAARLVSRHWRDEYLAKLRELSLGEAGASLLRAYVQHEDTARLMERRLELSPRLTGPTRSLLYHRLATHQPSLIMELADQDPISYVYVATKEGFIVTDDEAFEIASNAYGDEKFGLVIWCLGQQRKWDVLIRVAESVPDWSNRPRHPAVARLGQEEGR